MKTYITGAMIAAGVLTALAACQGNSTYKLTQGQTLAIQQYFISNARNPDDVQFRVITGTSGNNFCAEVNQENFAGGKTGFRAHHGKFNNAGQVTGVSQGGENSKCPTQPVTAI